ncbi:imidazole glycerol phosphate synthase subunit HisH [Rhodobaculum claviforme]|uniref:Imidazole glycerol phosphate synthase subunit HisH n=1 Tax=Rhodobaculum claviforme TaxID=1549854 RepID=A0A934TEY9_9RHOB|nr:imidazole glycerol phosphate synthase subunit HisH [Rhodobaculum claviforme]
MRVALVDYDSGNLHSAQKALERMAAEAGGGTVVVTSDPAELAAASHIVLPGDGAFPACRAALDAVPGMVDALERQVIGAGKPFLGICVGMQLLADRGREYSDTPGLGWIGGTVERIAPADPALKVPHMGWNDLVIDRVHPVLEGVCMGDHAYFVHSFHFAVTDPAHLLAHAEYGGARAAVVGRDNILGTQFHPEKSQATGLRMIANFLRWRP